ncbi:MAG TPA: c-type cytochrome [Terriglobia bacterium]|nr:c-type cytochrome [Terriglobia bacterium]
MRGAYIGMPLILAAIVGAGRGQQGTKPAENPPPASASTVETPLNPHYAISAEDRARKNPVQFTDASVEKGKKLFLSQCAMCHGATGDGKGDLAKEMNVTLPDFTKPETLQKRTDGELFKILGLGNDVMPGQAKRMNDIQCWEIINFLRAASGAVPQKSTGKELTDQRYVEVPK